jgi:hypothetical protein
MQLIRVIYEWIKNIKEKNKKQNKKKTEKRKKQRKKERKKKTNKKQTPIQTKREIYITCLLFFKNILNDFFTVFIHYYHKKLTEIFSMQKLWQHEEVKDFSKNKQIKWYCLFVIIIQY